VDIRTLLIGLAAWLALAVPALAQGRSEQAIDAGWRFQKGEVAGAADAATDTGGWLKVTLPHSFNAGDGEDGGGYYRGPGWYRRELVLERAPTGRLFLQFDGAALVAEVFVNGTSVGRHAGGYAAFRFDVTDVVRPGRNLLAVRVDNSPTSEVAPLGGDFTVFGGLYRGVRLIATPAVHIDALDHGGPGVYASVEALDAERAQLRVLIRARNDTGGEVLARVGASIVDAQGRSVSGAITTVRLAAGEIAPVVLNIGLPRPRLWDGRRDPYLYSVRTWVGDNGRSGRPDEVTVPLGIRSVHVDPQAGFLLNGRPHQLKGVNLFHSGRPGRGLAVGAAEIEEDFAIFEAMGVNAMRLVHFQHPQRAYELADRGGLVLWTEIPLNSKVDASPAFEANLIQQLRELIRQNFNHPSVAFWGLGNEIYASDETSNRLLARLHAEARAEDPSRLTVYAHCCGADDAPHTRHTDVIGFNKYFGWYPDQKGEIGDWADRAHALAPGRAMAVSEYGAGASVMHQEDPPKWPDAGGGWHPEQYQALVHENADRQLAARPWLWGRFVWVGADLASDGRNEGDRPGINDKGLVSYDRRQLKDAYYFYQARWSDRPMVHITSKRMTVRREAAVTVKTYSNQARARLTVNGQDLGERAVVDGVAAWPGVPLTMGDNRLEVIAGGARDAVVWRREPAAIAAE
jgi:hypothetical protein